MANSTGVGFPTTNLQKGHTFHDLDDGSTYIFIGGDPRLQSSWRLVNGVFGSQPDTSQWGLQQAGATWFLTSDKSYYGWDGTKIIQLANNAEYASIYNSTTSMIFQEDFISGPLTTGQIGLMGWQAVGGSSLLLTSEANHPGIFQRNTSAVANTVTTLSHYFGIATAWEATTYEVRWIVRPNNTDANATWRFGSMSSFVSNPPAFGVYFEKIGAETNWFTVSRVSAVQERQDTGIAIVEGAWYNFRVVVTALSVKFYLNHVLVATHTTNIPTFGQAAVQGVNLAAEAKTVDIDFCEVIVTGMNR